MTSVWQICVICLILMTCAPAQGISWKHETIVYNYDPNTDFYPTDSRLMDLAIDGNNNSHLVYYDGESGSVNYVTQIAGKWTSELLGQVVIGSSGKTCAVSIAVTSDGKPSICYGDGNTLGNLIYAEKPGPIWKKTVVDRGSRIGISNSMFGHAGRWSSLALDGKGNPSIVYTDGNSFSTLKYAMRNESGVWTTNVIDSGLHIAETGLAPRIKLDALGNPHVCYRSGNHFGTLKYAERTKDDFGVWSDWNVITLDEDGIIGDTGYSPSLALGRDGEPVISYYDASTSKLWVARKNPGKLTFYAWSLMCPPDGGIDRYTSVSVDQLNHLHISYFNSVSGVLNHAIYDGQTLLSVTPVETNGAGAYVVNVIDTGGVLHMAYYSDIDHTIQYATQE